MTRKEKVKVWNFFVELKKEGRMKKVEVESVEELDEVVRKDNADGEKAESLKTIRDAQLLCETEYNGSEVIDLRIMEDYGMKTLIKYHRLMGEQQAILRAYVSGVIDKEQFAIMAGREPNCVESCEI